MKFLVGVFLVFVCVLGIVSIGCVFELVYGDFDFGVKIISWIFVLVVFGMVGIFLFVICLNKLV